MEWNTVSLLQDQKVVCVGNLLKKTFLAAKWHGRFP